MCDGREEVFVVPVKPAAGAGWWIGKLLFENDFYCHVELLWVENAEDRGKGILSTDKRIERFGDISGALERLKTRGVSALV